jgi:DNA-binding response OmpR family regulator
VSQSHNLGGGPTSRVTGRIARILVVDDEVRVAQTLRVALSAEFDVTWTADPAEALAWLNAGDSYDVILCDLVMPKMNGVELCARVREFSPEVAARFVFMASGSLTPRVQELLATVSNTVLCKPFGLDDLRDRIRGWTRSGKAPNKAAGR